ncbi:MAG: ATP-binding protein [Gemmatimonadales bacterium]
MTFRTRLFVALAATAVIPLAVLAAGIAHELDWRLRDADRRRADGLAAQTRRDVESVASGVAERLASVRDGLADDNRFRAAAVLGTAGERPYLLDYAARAMRLSGLAMLQIENDSGRILSSGHYRNEYDRLDTGLLPALRQAPDGVALMWARTPAGPILVLARADSLQLGGRRFVLVGGAEATPQRLGHAAADSELSVALTVPQPATGPFAEPAVVSQPRVSGASLVSSFSFPAITAASNGTRTLSAARFDVTQSLSGLRVLRAAVLRWCLVAALSAAAAALLAANWLAERISRPIRILAEQSAQVDLVPSATPLVTGFPTDRTDEIGALSRVLGTMVRRLRTTAAGLREAERRAAMGDLARQVTHDVKNGLVPIRHVMRHLTEIQRSQPEQMATVFAERRPTLDASIGYLDELARNYARLTPRADIGPCDINAVAAAVASGYATPDTAPGPGETAITLRLDPNVPRVTADPLLMRRILENVVSNALDATRPMNGGVTITTEPAGDGVCVTIADSGCGMSPDELQSAFSDFFTTKPNGTGLGLSIVRRLVHDVHGVLRVDTAPGRGTRVTLTFQGPATPSVAGISAAPLQTRAS